MQRRQFIKNSSALVGLFPFLQANPFTTFKTMVMDTEVVKRKIGAFDCTIFKDLQFKYMAKDFFINADPEELHQSMEKYIHSGKEQLLYISDAFLHPLHIERVDWQTNYDLDQQKAKLTRIKLFELAHKEGMLVNAFHFDFPGLGNIDKHKDTWIWNYVSI